MSRHVWPYFLLLALLLSTVHAFGAGNIASISRVEGQNWRHGDIEDTLLAINLAKVAGGKKFRGLDVKRVYFGNWLRDYSQAIDVGTVKHIPAEAIRILLWILAFLSFGYGTGEFEVTAERLGCYRPEEHIDNPKDYADNTDARQVDSRLRGPVDEAVELAIDPRTGLKMYIASEDKGIATSAGLVRNLFGRCIQLGRQYGRTKNKADFYEALRLLGTASHCLEDFSAHSNYVEIALRNCGVGEIFPMVGNNVTVHVQGVGHPIYPIVTGTFGGVDFLHSVTGEFSDHVTQSEIQELEGSVESAQNQENPSLLKELLRKLPSSIFGGNDEAAKVDELQANAAAQRMRGLEISPQNGAAWQQQLQDVSKQIYPILEFHDEVMQKISSFVEHVPILPGLLEKIQEQINVFAFSLLAPYILPIIKQVKSELAFGSSKIIQNSRAKQLNIFKDDHCSDPTHSMLSKDHFSNVLNEPAGKVASQVLKWVVPQIMACWDDERIDVNRTLNRIVRGVFHHPALRNQGEDGARDCRQIMFGVVEKWWRDKTEQERKVLRSQLSRQGVEAGRNHKDGVHDTGHGSCKPPGASVGHSNPVLGSGPGSGQPGYIDPPGPHGINRIQNLASEAIGGGVLGSLVGGFVGKMGSNLLGKTFSGQSDQIYSSQEQSQNLDNSVTATYMQAGYHPPSHSEPEKYGQAQLQQTTYPGGGIQQGYQRYEQDVQGQTTSYTYQGKIEAAPSYGGGPEQTIEQRYGSTDEQWGAQTQYEHMGPTAQYPIPETQLHGEDIYHGVPAGSISSESSDDGSEGMDKKERKRLKRERKRREREERKRRENELMFAQTQGPGASHQQRPQSPAGNYHFMPPRPYATNDSLESGGFHSGHSTAQPPYGMMEQVPPAGGYQQYGSNYPPQPYIPPGADRPFAATADMPPWQSQQQEPYQSYGGPSAGQQPYNSYGGGYGPNDSGLGYGGPNFGQAPTGGGSGGSFQPQSSGFPGAYGHGAEEHGQGQEYQGGSYDHGPLQEGYGWFDRERD